MERSPLVVGFSTLFRLQLEMSLVQLLVHFAGLDPDRVYPVIWGKDLCLIELHKVV